jgi:hypothetical protein
VIFRRQKPPYSQHDIARQIGDIAKLQEIKGSAHADEEKERADSAIEVAQEILQYMLEEVQAYHKKR